MASEKSKEVDYNGQLVEKFLVQTKNSWELLKSCLELNSWEIKSVAENNGYKTVEIDNSLIGRYTLNLYYSNLKFDIQRPDYRNINLGANIEDPFDLKNRDSNNTLTFILGLYTFDKDDDFRDLVLILFPITARDWSANPSLRVKTEIIQETRINGLCNWKNKSGDLFIALRSSLLHNCLINYSNFSNLNVISTIKNKDAFVKKKSLLSYTKTELDDSESIKSISPRNQIFYGAPGTGKSYHLNKLAENKFDEDNTKRVTFHPSYSYQQFVGSYKPSPVYKTINKDPEELYKINKTDKHDDQFEPLIDYTFVAGPFMEILVEALQAENSEQEYLLIVEEINRANVASVFGDVFQLLDRNSKGDSTYAISFNTDIKNHLESRGITNKMIRIPKNLHIWATMNNADQGVMPLDTAFKRRWSFKYISIDEFEDAMEGETIRLVDKCYDWNDFRHELNDKLKTHVHEDKLIGPFFMNSQELNIPDIVLSKLVLYLREDVLRHNPSLLFGELKTFSDISDEFKLDHKKVFKELDWNNIKDDITCPEPLSDDDEGGDSVNPESDDPIKMIGEIVNIRIENRIKLYDLEDGDTLYKKYSKKYKGGDFWFGITPSTVEILNDNNVSRVVFVLERQGMVECPLNIFNSFINNAKTTKKEDNETVKHYHIFISPPPDTKLFSTIGENEFNLNDSFTSFD